MRARGASRPARAPGPAGRRAAAALERAGIVLALLLVACSAGDGEAAGEAGRPEVRGDAGGEASAQEPAGEPGRPAPALSPAGMRLATIRVDGHEVTAEIAETEEQRQQGLMNRDSLPEDHGMLFVYPEQRTLTFWMRNTRIPLDIAFIDRGGRIVDIQQMEPMSDQTHSSRSPAMYALEMRHGWFGDHEVRVGARVEF